jgi:hypothetical protein
MPSPIEYVCIRNNANTGACIEPYTYKQTCDANIKIADAASGYRCPDFNSEVACSSGEKCYPTGSDTVGAGVGDCRCIGGCSGDETKPYNGDETKYIKCVQSPSSATCRIWNAVPSSCATGLKYDDLLKTCVCASSYNSRQNCDPAINPFSCTSSNAYQKCESVPISDSFFGTKTCNFFGSTISCNDAVCDSKAGSSSICKCSSTTTCAIGIDCLADNTNANKYFDCKIETGNSCPAISKTSIDLPAGRMCINGKITTSAKCPYTPCGPDYTCNSVGACVPKTTDTYCTSADINNPTCNGEAQKKECIQVATSNPPVYKWTYTNAASNQRCVLGSLVCKNVEPYCDQSTFKSTCNGLTAQYNCSSTVENGITCAKKESTACLPDQECGASGNCACKTTGDFCSKEEFLDKKVRCDPDDTSILKRQQCVPNQNCYKWQTFNTCTSGQLCSNGACATQGCEFNTTNMLCANQLNKFDDNNLPFEICKQNSCLNINDSYSVKVSEATKTAKCFGNVIATKNTYVGTAGSYNRWIVNSANACSKDKPICVDTETSASCEPFGDVSITCNDDVCNFPVNKVMSGIKITVKPNVPLTSSTITLLLCKKGTPGNDCSTVANKAYYLYRQDFTLKNSPTTAGLKEVIIDCKSSGVCFNIPLTTIKSDDYVLQLKTSGLNYTTSLLVHVKPAIDLILSCTPTSISQGRTTACTWKALNKETGIQITNGVPDFKVVSCLNGETSIDYTPSPSGVSITAPSGDDLSGTIDLTVEATNTLYLSDSKTYNLNIIPITRVPKLYIDDKKWPDDFADGQISTGSHNIKVTVDENGITPDIQTVIGTLRTPSQTATEGTILNFVKSGDDWIVGTDIFKQSGQGYILNVEIKYVDLSKPDQNPSYNIKTAGSGIVDKPTVNWYLWGTIIGIVIAIFISVIVAGSIMSKRK